MIHKCYKCKADIPLKPYHEPGRRSILCKDCNAVAARGRRARKKAAGIYKRWKNPNHERELELKRIRNKRPAAREWNKKYKRAEWRDPSRRWILQSRNAARAAIRGGKLVPQPCEICGAVKVHAHHEDYTKPLEVRWLCSAHHRAHHQAIKRRVSVEEDGD